MTRARHPRARRWRVVAAMGTAGLVSILAASPAAAHSTSGPPASNFTTGLTGMRPTVPGVHASLSPDGERIRLTVTGPHAVTVLGYRSEPYLRVTRHEVLENRASPAVALNRTRVPTGPAPPGTGGPPRWVRISTDGTAEWHDHRAHWMGGTTPRSVHRNPDRTHVIEHWTVPLRIGDDDGGAVITGTITYHPPPIAWAWWLLAGALALVVVLAVRWWPRPAAPTAVAAVGIAEALHLWGSWPFSTASTGGRIGENLPSIAAVVVAGLTLVWLARRGVRSAAPGVLLTGLFAFVAGGLADIPTLSHSWVPSRLDPTGARLLVAIALGVGFGLIVVGATRLRRAPTGSAATTGVDA